MTLKGTVSVFQVSLDEKMKIVKIHNGILKSFVGSSMNQISMYMILKNDTFKLGKP